jgi:hypothetical protein
MPIPNELQPLADELYALAEEVAAHDLCADDDIDLVIAARLIHEMADAIEALIHTPLTWLEAA